MKRSVLGLAVLTALVAFLLWWFSPVQVVKRRSGSLLETLTLEEGGHRASRHAGAYALNALLAPQVELESPDIAQANGSFERSELESAFSWVGGRALRASFEADGFDSVEIDGGRAVVILPVEALVEFEDRRPLDGRYRVRLEWRQDESRTWRLTRASWNAAAEAP